MKNFKIFYEKQDEEICEDLAEREPKDRRTKRFRKNKEIDYPSGFDKYCQRLAPKH